MVFCVHKLKRTLRISFLKLEKKLIKATCTTENKGEETYNMLYDGSSIYDEP